MNKKVTKPKGDRIANAFSRFPMFMIIVVKVLLQNGGDMTMEEFSKKMKAPSLWFKDTCEKSKIFNTFPLDKIEVFTLYTKTDKTKTYECIKLENSDSWMRHYKEALEKVLRV